MHMFKLTPDTEVVVYDSLVRRLKESLGNLTLVNYCEYIPGSSEYSRSTSGIIYPLNKNKTWEELCGEPVVRTGDRKFKVRVPKYRGVEDFMFSYGTVRLIYQPAYTNLVLTNAMDRTLSLQFCQGSGPQ